MVIINKVNEVYVKIDCEPSILQELSDNFTFYAPNYKYHPKFKARVWDGKIRLLNYRTKEIYAGLTQYIEKFCFDRNYECSFNNFSNNQEFSLIEAKQFISTLNIPPQFELRDYQVETLAYCIRNSRALFVSPTASGKSMMIYQLLRYYNKPTLIIVPRTGLITQMISDFKEYGYDISNIHSIFSGQEKETNKQVVITTWQSAYKMPEKWFAKFNVVFGDEAHNFKATSLISIMSKMKNTEYRFGFTGSLDNIESNKITLEGLFGPHKKIVSTSELMEANHIATLKMKIILLKYTDEEKKLLKKAKYADERNWLVNHSKRNNFIKNLALSLKGNTLVLFRLVDKHGVPLHNIIQKSDPNKKVYLVHGKTDIEEREYIRKIVNTDENSIIVASIGTFSEGINIPNIHNIIFASPTKSRINVMQMIGRALRKTNTKKIATIFDIADDISWKSWKNYTLKHLFERVKYYNEEKFSYKIYKVDIK